jgi:hypothetical protein
MLDIWTLDDERDENAKSEHRVTTFHRHLIEMTLSMAIPWSAFFVVVHFALPGAGFTPASFLLMPVAIVVMVVPMTALMLYRGHGLRDIIEMNAAMFAGMIVVMPMVRVVLPTLGVQLGLDLIFPIALVAMTAPMVVLMYLRREHYSHHVHAGMASSG